MIHNVSRYTNPWHHGLAPAAIDWAGLAMISFGAVEIYRWWAGI